MEQESSNVRALKAGGWYVISTFIIRGFSYLTTPIFTRLLTTEEYGIVSNYQSWLSLFTVIASLDLYSCIMLSKVHFDKDNKEFLSSITLLSSCAVALTYLVCKVIQFIFPSAFELPTGLLEIMFIEILCRNVFTLFQTNHRVYLRYKAYVAMSAVSTGASTALAIVLVLTLKAPRYYGKIIGNALPMVILGLVLLIFIFVRGKTFFSWKYWKFGLRMSVPLIPHHLAGDILTSFDRILINRFLGSSMTAIYTVASNYGLILQVLWNAFNGAWTPWFYDKMHENSEKSINEIKSFAKPYTVAFIALALLFEVAAPEAILVFGTREYKGGEYVVPFVIAGIVCQFVYSLYVNIEFFYQKTVRIMIGTVCAATLNLVLNIIFIPRFGYIAAAVTTFISYFVLMFFHYFLSRPLEKRDIYGRSFLVKTVVIFLAISVGITLLYPFIWIRYVIAAVACVIFIYRYRKMIKKVWNTFIRRHV